MPDSALSPLRRNLRARKAVAVRLGQHNEAARLDTEIRAERLAEYIRQTVEAAPPLTEAQRDRLALLLRADNLTRQVAS